MYLLLGTVSIGHSKKMKVQESIGTDIIKYFLDIHTQYIWTCLVFWMTLLYNALYLMYMNSYKFQNPITSVVDAEEIRNVVRRSELAYIVYNATLFLILMQGLVLAVVRTNEPVYRFIIKREMLSWFGVMYNPELKRNDMRKNSAL